MTTSKGQQKPRRTLQHAPLPGSGESQTDCPSGGAPLTPLPQTPWDVPSPRPEPVASTPPCHPFLSPSTQQALGYTGRELCPPSESHVLTVGVLWCPPSLWALPQFPSVCLPAKLLFILQSPAQ